MDITEMVKSISDRGGILKPHQYSVSLKIPRAMISGGDSQNQITEHLAIRTERVTLPSVNMSVFEYPSSSNETFPMIKGKAPHEPINIGIILSEDLREKRWFDNWYNNIHSFKTKYIPRYYDDYAESAELRVQIEASMRKNTEKLNLPIYVYYGIYPTSIGDIELSYGDNDTYTSFAVTLNWESYDEITSK